MGTFRFFLKYLHPSRFRGTRYQVYSLRGV